MANLDGVVLLVMMAALASSGLVTGSAQEASPVSVRFPLVPDASQCTVAPRELASIPGALTTPNPDEVAAGMATSAAIWEGVREGWASPVPVSRGRPADETTAAAVIETDVAFFACQNMGDTPRYYALHSDALLERMGPQYLSAEALTPTPLPPEYRVTVLGVTDIGVLSDWRVNAFVVWTHPTLLRPDTMSFVFAQAHGQWLVDDIQYFQPAVPLLPELPRATAIPSPLMATPAATTGLVVVLEPRLTGGGKITPETLMASKTVLEQRLDALELQGAVTLREDGRINVRVPAVTDPETVVRALQEIALLEIIDPEGHYLPPGTIVTTSLDGPEVAGVAATPTGPVYQTIISGDDLAEVFVTTGTTGFNPVIGFELQEDAASTFFQYTSAHVDQPMAIVIDKQVISLPTISGPIFSQGIIEGIPPEEVETVVAQLASGALPVSLVVIEERLIPLDQASPTAAEQ